MESAFRKSGNSSYLISLQPSVRAMGWVRCRDGCGLPRPGFRVVLAQVTRFIARDVAEDHTKAVRGKGGCPSFHSHEGEEKEEEEEAKHIFFLFLF